MFNRHSKKKIPNHSRLVINNWLRNNSTIIEYLGLWETLNNPIFKVIEFEYFKNYSGENSFVLTAQDKIQIVNFYGKQRR